MEFLEDFAELEPGQRERFQQVVTRLLAGEVLTPGPALRPDPDWRFAERFRELIDSYLRIGGWRFDIDLGLRLARAVHETGAQRVRFSKLESLLLCALRLFYHEQMRAAGDELRCEIQVGTLRERLVHAGKSAAQLSARVLAPALRRLARHSLVQVARGFEGHDDETVVVTPLVEKVLPPDRIQDIEQRIKTYLVSRAATEPPEAEAESGANGGDDDTDEGGQ
ncbi:MAG: DUF4194 domain-containing protein [Deltaproteobacteria bacterium]|nr:DUF4194 domain-containing protein [Deltaproteobacteria bacterium]